MQNLSVANRHFEVLTETVKNLLWSLWYVSNACNGRTSGNESLTFDMKALCLFEQILNGA